MALPSAIKLFINPRTGLAFGNFNGTSQVNNPTLTLGDTARLEIYFVEDTNINSYPRQEIELPGSPGIKVAVGPIDEPPQAGTWKVSFGGNTTAALAYNITAAALATALNGLASITAAGGVTVSKVGDNYNIVFNENGLRGDILTDGSALIPLSTASVANLQLGNSSRPQIALLHLQRTVAGLATSFTATPASVISVVSLSAWDGSRATYRVSISPDPKGGSFSLAFDAVTGTDVSSASIAVGASAVDVQNALSIGALAEGKVSVSQVGAYDYDITVLVEPGSGGLTAVGAGLISFSGYIGELSLNTVEAVSLLDGANEVLTNLEVEITSEGKTLTVLQIPCTLQNSVIDAGSLQPLVLDSYLSQASADGRYLRQANNLSDLQSASTARTNLGVYSTSSVDSALAIKANLAGATFSGNIIRDNGLGQTIIAPGSIGFSQTGGGGSFVTYGSTAITFADATTQSSAYTTTAVNGLIDARAYPLVGNPSAFLQASALTPYLSKADNLASLDSASTARQNLGLGSAALSSSTDFAVSQRGLPASGTTGQVLAKVNGSDYNATWTSLILGDRYLTSSTSANTIGNGTKVFQVATGLSYTPTQSVTISYNDTNHMHAEVVSYNSGNGALVVDATSHEGSGTYSAWIINVGGVTPLQSVAWGSIVGTIGNQSDLATALNAKLSVTTAVSDYAPIGRAIPSGGTTGQVLAKSSGTNYATEWVTPSSGGSFTGGAITSPITFAVSGSSTAEMTNGSFQVSYDASNYAYLGFTSVYITGGYGTINISPSNGGITLTDGPGTPALSFKTDNAYLNQYGLGWVSGSTYTAYRQNGITFPDNSFQSTAGLTSPGSGNYVWYNGSWYSANTTSIYDSNSGNYVNVLTF